ncbi:cupin domain-containing protein [Candidatus Microgenomates bacterium]|nr:cupin domain-containing protein [Candidatus Microgenomates bacterium]
MSKPIIGKIIKQQKDLKGWLVGQFIADGSPFRDKNVEIYYKTFPVGDKSDKLHKHPHGREYLIVISGKAKMRVGDYIVELKQGDYVAVPNNTPDCLVKVEERLSIIGVRYPSVPNNKVFLE